MMLQVIHNYLPMLMLSQHILGGNEWARVNPHANRCQQRRALKPVRRSKRLARHIRRAFPHSGNSLRRWADTSWGTALGSSNRPSTQSPNNEHMEAVLGKLQCRSHLRSRGCTAAVSGNRCCSRRAAIRWGKLSFENGRPTVRTPVLFPHWSDETVRGKSQSRKPLLLYAS
jgi:hypothetical protein